MLDSIIHLQNHRWKPKLLVINRELRVYRFYTQNSNLEPQDVINLEASESKHAIRILRIKKDDKIIIFNDQLSFSGVVISTDKNILRVKLESILESQKVNKHSINALICLSKMPSFELVIQKLTELNIDTITPIISDFSVVEIKDWAKKKERFEKIITEALKQSERLGRIKINDPINFVEIPDFIEKNAPILFFTTEIEGEKIKLEKLQSFKTLYFVIGPEGGFSEKELKFLHTYKNVGFYKISDNVLKTETAAIAAASILEQLNF